MAGNVFFLGLVSFCTDFASEAMYPLLPAFFTGLVGASAAAVYVGVMEGLAESVSSLLKLYAGRLSDMRRSRKPLTLIGYAVSAFVRPVMSLAAAGWHVVALRFVDRIGKGLRTSPRDALISETIDADVRGVAFSFHRMMDHAGAVTGPVFAAVFLGATLGNPLLWAADAHAISPVEMHALRRLFVLTLIPGLAAVLVLARWVREPAHKRAEAPGGGDPPETLPPRNPTPGFARFLMAIVLFTLGNSSDLFLVFYAQARFGLGLGWVIVFWIWLHLAKIIFSLPGGRLSDRLGRRHAILAGWAVYTLVYLAFPLAHRLWMLASLLGAYGAYYGLTEGAERALVADFVPPERRGRAYGWYHASVGLAALPASLVFGVFWAKLGPRTAFFIGAALAAAATIVLLTVPPVAVRSEADISGSPPTVQGTH